jgi:hypothetical protein
MRFRRQTTEGFSARGAESAEKSGGCFPLRTPRLCATLLFCILHFAFCISALAQLDNPAFIGALSPRSSAASGPTFHFDVFIEPGYNSTTAYGAPITSTQLAASTISSGGLAPLTIWQGGTELAPGGTITNLWLKNSNCPPTSPFGNITVGGSAVAWLGSNVWGFNTVGADLVFEQAIPNPATTPEITIYLGMTLPFSRTGTGFDVMQMQEGGGYPAYGTYVDNVPNPLVRAENYGSYDSPTINIVQGDQVVYIEDFVQGGNASIWVWDYTQGVLSGPQTVTLASSTGGWTFADMLAPNMEGYSASTGVFEWDFFAFGIITNATSRYGTVPMPTVAATPVPFPLLNALVLYDEANYTTGVVGMAFSSESNINLTALGRWITAGNAQAHTVYLEDSNGNVIGSVYLNATAVSGAPPDQMLYGNLGSPILITAGDLYFLMSSETNGGDNWWGPNDSVYPNFLINVLGPVWGTGPNTAPSYNNHNENLNGPVGGLFTRP